jgi:hypothetical protein
LLNNFSTSLLQLASRCVRIRLVFSPRYSWGRYESFFCVYVLTKSQINISELQPYAIAGKTLLNAANLQTVKFALDELGHKILKAAL